MPNIVRRALKYQDFGSCYFSLIVIQQKMKNVCLCCKKVKIKGLLRR